MDVDLDLKKFGNNFVRKYYSTLSKCPHNLSKYYEKNSIFMHQKVTADAKFVVGQKDIHDRVEQLGYKGCNTNILSVNTEKLYNYIVIVIVGDLTKHNNNQRKFSQTIVLDRNIKDECVIKNDTLFYLDHTVQFNIDNKEVTTYTKKIQNQTCNRKMQSLSQYDKMLYPPRSNQLFVSGIPANTKPQDLSHFFEQYGQLYSLRIMTKNVNYGFVTYATSESTQAVLQNRPITYPDKTGVWLVIKEKKKTYHYKENKYLPTSHQLFVGDIPVNVTSDELKQFFSIWGDVVSARIITTEKNLEPTKDFVPGFVTFMTADSAKKVLSNQPIMYPDQNGIALKVMEKISRVQKKKSIVHEEYQKNVNDDGSLFICF
ncbi:hypothetical protein AGLY_012497 [Aphis glycines]|uniref:RRM domain-containing protein n=1 Tax=Aphis glycines TaxID=307491 RepID=A0A6G0T9U8_APHGL|nr:hypothetical protein AGLY_012497 [Aphis glycines]